VRNEGPAATRPAAIERYLPVFDVADYREAPVAAEPGAAWQALRDFDLRRSRIVRALFALRTIPERWRAGAVPAPCPGPFVDEALRLGWVLLEETPGEEIVLGAVTKPWEPVVRFRGIPGREFLAFSEPGFAKIVWNLAVRPGRRAGSVVSTETRVSTTDADSRRRFRRYWRIFGPGIRLIRRIVLGRIQADLRSAARRRTPRRALYNPAD
jgi:hypothetical protein